MRVNNKNPSGPGGTPFTVVHSAPQHEPHGATSKACDKTPPNPDSIVKLIETQAKTNPHHTAITFDNEKLSYGELDQRSNALVNIFQENKLKPGDLIGIYVNRGFNFITALVACMKCELTFIPIDKNNPSDRINWILNNSETKFLLTEKKTRLNLPDDIQHVFIPDKYTFNKNATQTTVNKKNNSQHAYIIYTSGSTGKPKGVLIKQRALETLVRFQLNTFKLSPSDHVLGFSSEGFDAAIWEIFSTLAAGATLHIFPRKKFISPRTLNKFLQNQKITIATVPPCLLRLMHPSNGSALRLLFSAGESCTREIVDTWGSKTTFINAYGLAETTVCATISKPLNPGDNINIGKPINGAEIFILDEHKKPVPTGKQGEIYIAGDLLASRYINNDEMNSKRFLTISEVSNKTLLKTGDIGIKLEDGSFKFIGRVDNQINLNGIRIEPEEIESQLLTLPNVEECLVLAKTKNQRTHIIAYVKVSNPKTIDLKLLREELKKKLPKHMIPSAFVTINKMPTTVHNKADRLMMQS